MRDFRYLVIASVALLSACGGSGGGGGGGANSDFDALVNRAEALSDALDEVDDLETPVAALPTSGSATYSGVAVYFGVDVGGSDPEVFGALGEFVGEANFASETFTGTADSFIEITNAEALVDDEIENIDAIGGNRISGSFTVDTTFDSIDDGGTERSILVGDIDGSIVHADGSTQTYTGLEVEGGFFGPSGTLVNVDGFGISSGGVAGAVGMLGSR